MPFQPTIYPQQQLECDISFLGGFFPTYKHHGSPIPRTVRIIGRRVEEATSGRRVGETRWMSSRTSMVFFCWFPFFCVFCRDGNVFLGFGGDFLLQIRDGLHIFFFRSFSWNIFWNKASLYVFVTVSSENVWGSKYCWPETLGLAGHGTHPMFSNLAFRPGFLCDHLFQLVGSNATQQVEFHLLVTPNPVSSGQEARGQPAGVAVSERGTPPTV